MIQGPHLKASDLDNTELQHNHHNNSPPRNESQLVEGEKKTGQWAQVMTWSLYATQGFYTEQCKDPSSGWDLFCCYEEMDQTHDYILYLSLMVLHILYYWLLLNFYIQGLNKHE